MSFVLDTDHCVFWLRNQPQLLNKLAVVNWGDIFPSPITVAELYHGAYKSADPEKNLGRIRTLLSFVTVLPLTDETLLHFGRVKSMLERRGERLDDLDLLIAATALDEGSILVTHNTRHFQRIPGLSLEDWTLP